MPPKKATLDPLSAAPGSSSNERKVPLHPKTIVMVEEAMKELDTRKGITSAAIRNFIKEKYPSMDLVRLKYLFRNALAKGLESGLFVRAANSPVSGSGTRFRLAAKIKSSVKSKTTESIDPNVVKAPKAAKAGIKKSAKDKEAGEKAKKRTAPVKKLKEKVLKAGPISVVKSPKAGVKKGKAKEKEAGEKAKKGAAPVKKQAAEDPKPKKSAKAKESSKGAAASKVAPAKRPRAKASTGGDVKAEVPKAQKKTKAEAPKSDSRTRRKNVTE